MATPTNNDITSIQNEHNDQNHDFPELCTITERLYTETKGQNPSVQHSLHRMGISNHLKKKNTIQIRALSNKKTLVVYGIL